MHEIEAFSLQANWRVAGPPADQFRNMNPLPERFLVSSAFSASLGQETYDEFHHLADHWGHSRLAGQHSDADRRSRSEEHTSALQSLMRIQYAVFCLKKKN